MHPRSTIRGAIKIAYLTVTVTVTVTVTGGIDESVFYDVAGDSPEDELYKPLVWHETLNRLVRFTAFATRSSSLDVTVVHIPRVLLRTAEFT